MELLYTRSGQIARLPLGRRGDCRHLRYQTAALLFCRPLERQRSHFKRAPFWFDKPEGNHGEDVKEYYFYLDNLPSHAYMKYLYKYPQEAFPYENLIEENGREQGKTLSMNYLTQKFSMTTAITMFLSSMRKEPRKTCLSRSPFTIGAKRRPHCICCLELWFRNTWSWKEGQTKPAMIFDGKGIKTIHPQVGGYFLYGEGANEWLFTENENESGKIVFHTKHFPICKRWLS